MLKWRVLTALVLAPLAIWGTLALPDLWFAVIMGVIFSLGAWEWSGLLGLRSSAWRHLYLVTFIWLLLLLILLGPQALRAALLPSALVAVAWWIAVLLFILRFPAGSALWTRSPLLTALAGLLTLIPGWIGLVAVRLEAGPVFALLLLLMIWGADIGAYFAGRAWGRRKLVPAVSPGKTWAGFWGGMGAALFVMVVAFNVLHAPVHVWLPLLVVALIAIAFSVVGDLGESMFKRLAGVKDSGAILPGHGGMLDRIDSLTAAAPWFALGIYLWHRMA